MALRRKERLPHVDPAVLDPLAGEILRDDSGGYQLAESHYRVVPQLGVGRAVDRIAHGVAQLFEEQLDTHDPGRRAVQIVDYALVIIPYPGHAFERRIGLVPLHGLEDALQGVRSLAHGRYDDEQLALGAYYVEQVSYAVGVLDRGAAEFIDFHSNGIIV